MFRALSRRPRDAAQVFHSVRRYLPIGRRRRQRAGSRTSFHGVRYRRGAGGTGHSCSRIFGRGTPETLSAPSSHPASCSSARRVDEDTPTGAGRVRSRCGLQPGSLLLDRCEPVLLGRHTEQLEGRHREHVGLGLVNTDAEGRRPCLLRGEDLVAGGDVLPAPRSGRCLQRRSFRPDCRTASAAPRVPDRNRTDRPG